MKIVSVIGLISAFLLAIIVYLTTNNYIFALVFLFIFYVTHEYIKQYADVAEFMVLELQFKIRQTLIDLSIVWQFRFVCLLFILRMWRNWQTRQI